MHDVAGMNDYVRHWIKRIDIGDRPPQIIGTSICIRGIERQMRIGNLRDQHGDTGALGIQAGVVFFQDGYDFGTAKLQWDVRVVQ